LTDKAYSFDASLLPDGGYTVKVVASDAPSHSPGEAFTAERESRRFEVDTTPPRIENLTASLEGGQIHVRFRAEDGFSPSRSAEYSVDAGEWKYVEPVGKISDAKVEKYDFKVPRRGKMRPRLRSMWSWCAFTTGTRIWAPPRPLVKGK
jgi:hypothetical protein